MKRNKKKIVPTLRVGKTSDGENVTLAIEEKSEPIAFEENKILEKTNRQKVLEVEELTQTIQELEEAILAGGTAANVIRDYRRQISEQLKRGHWRGSLKGLKSTQTE
ncbi:microtubule-associated protein 70-5-like [Tripterygium wilfordii]|uniref:microtubule-associated protein 70-5-like n=1 Tax=Tripterygium wilfordii TaxID=458696 RepID=UPI0018F82539|nr:microtubule-associated protein 70-5-like [Tripterygium wilfordii]